MAAGRWGVGGELPNALWPAGGAEPGNPLALSPQLSLVSAPGVEEGQGQGPGGLRPGGCIEIASSARTGRHGQGSRREVGFPAIHHQSCSSQVKQRRLPTSHT